MINLGIACAINSLAILAQPLTHYMQAVGNGLVKLSILVGIKLRRIKLVILSPIPFLIVVVRLLIFYFRFIYI